jgi:phosphotransferase system enzyme I (PtsI)
MHKGIAVSPGVAVGVAHKVESVFGPAEPQRLSGPEEVAEEAARFDRAVALADAELEGLVLKVAEQLGPGEAEIFQSHLTIIHDEALLERVRAHIRERQLTALSALHIVLKDYAAAFARSEHEYFRERMADVRDVISRIGTHLSLQAAGFADEPRPAASANGHGPPNGAGAEAPAEGADPIILVAHELLPSQAMSLGSLPIAGIVTETGGGTSHAAILSRSRGIPAVSGCAEITGEVQDGDLVVVDGREGVVLVRPDAETVSAYRKLQREFFQLKGQLVANRDQPSVSKDGVQVELLANINNVADAQAAEKVGATGVGLFRTEYLFITHADVPDEQEQYEYYRRVIEASPNRAATIRTLDLGGDKTVPYLGRRNEPNPFMGWRSIRLSFEHPRLFERQIRAILRAGRHGRVNMLFPMITTLEELRHVNRLVDEAKRNLRREGIPFGEDVKTGVMVEVPAAAVCIDAILRETDFISIGSNDLIQYLVAADRDNPKVAHLCEPLSPAIFRVLHMVLEACRRTGTPVTLCGEMAGQPRSVLALFGLGLRRFSMSPAFVPTIKALLSRITTAQAERFAHQVLQLKTNEEIRKYLNERLHEVSSDLEVFDFA